MDCGILIFEQLSDRLHKIEQVYNDITSKTIKIEYNADRGIPHTTVSILGYNMCITLKNLRWLEEYPITEIVDYILKTEEIIKEHMLAMRKKGATL